MFNNEMYELVPIINGHVVNWATDFSVENNVATVKMLVINVSQIRSFLNSETGVVLSFSYGLRGEVEKLGDITSARVSAIESPVDGVSKISIEFTYTDI